MTDQATPAKVRLTDELGPDVTAWVCEYMSGEVFVSLAQYPMHDPDVRKAWRLFTIAQRDAAVAAEVKALRATLAMVADIAHSGGLAHHTDATAMNAIRRLTLKEWNPHGTTDEHRERVQEAGRESLRRSGA